MKNRYKFKLIGFDEEWTESGNRNYTTYTNLPAGHYTFVVQGANNDGVWGREPATLEVSVEAPPWVRWWAFLAYFVFAAGVYAVAVRIREGRLLKARVHELTETRERLQAANRRLEELSKKDALTGLFNRRYLDARLVEELARARHSGAPLSILVVDVDRFKAYNDRYGHEAGDESLKVVAQTLEQEVNRASDFVTRYGGEEFCIVLPQTDGTGALAVAHRVNSAVRRRSIVHESSDVDEYLTVSVGACTWTVANGRPLEGLVSAADAALYRAKQSGRNAVEACEDAESA
jgi:diguanylate cyclase (GGDEF)-like protein